MDDLLLAGRNTNVLNSLVEQAMAWVDNYSITPLMVPLTCWIRPPLCPLVVTFKLQDWASAATGTWTIVQPTINYQHLLATGNKNGTLIWMYHIASHTLVKTFAGKVAKVGGSLKEFSRKILDRHILKHIDG